MNTFELLLRRALFFLVLTLVTGCTASPPSNPNDICSIFREKSDWYSAAVESEKKWGSSIPIMMAIMRHESGFVADAKPARMRILWIIPGPRPSDAYGYPQALNDTWSWYKSDTGHWLADRDEFSDAIDFMGWYNYQTSVRNKVKLTDTFNLYLAYHEGQKGYQQGTYRGKTWLKNTASSVTQRANNYKKQLDGCKNEFSERSSWF